ncbi:LysR family transcriptional regulator [Sulfitobacter mediterraneus]|uniref:LysR family transcriptional regulator n=1 Tax=Sulfitobacter mediterraneus TaxID=83219 RepID=UPI0024931DF7|nr:LysR family transcriptional regulator [Sulfitobacter mediterraneus]
MHNSNWDNLRYVLSVIEAGSVSAAARNLGVNHATVLRRVATFEAQNGGALFDRNANGYRLLPGKEALVQAVREVENAVLSVERLMLGANPQLSGVVRISSTDTICQYLLPDVLQSLKAEAPQLEIELLSNNSHLNFARMEADLFVRPAMTLPEDMIATSVRPLVFRAYAISPDQDKWFRLQGPLARSAPAKWLSTNVQGDSLRSGSDSFVVLSRMAQSGAGIAILPSFVGEQVTGLVHLVDRMPDIEVPIWVGSHQDLRDIPRIRAVRNCVIAHLSAPRI